MSDPLEYFPMQNRASLLGEARFLLISVFEAIHRLFFEKISAVFQ